jgi:parallel beta-helix repeat protein
LSFSANQLLSGTPSSSDVGSYWVNITVSDVNNYDSTNFTLIVLKKIEPSNTSKGSIINIRTQERFSTIQDSIDKAQPGDKIRVYSGIYFENVIVNKSVILIGNGSANTFINGRGSGNVFTILSNNCKISEFTIINSSDKWYSNWRHSGIKIIADNIVIKNCTIKSHKNHGINIKNSNNNSIINCIFESNTRAINIESSNFNKIRNCDIKSSSWSAINITNSNKNEIINCNISVIDVGINIVGSNNKIISNQFEIITYYALRIDHGVSNLIYLNIFNNIRVLDNGVNNHWNSSTKGNFWSDWTSPDNNLDGIVDIPYNISGNAGTKDFYPIVKSTNKIMYSPTITTINVLNAYVDILYSVKYSALDMDTPLNNLSWFFKTNGSWLTFSSKQVLSGTPSSSNIGTYWVNIQVSDGNNFEIINFTITVKSKKPSTNTMPEIISTFPTFNTNNVSINISNILISFSKPMNRSSVEASISIFPSVNYTLIWNENFTQMKIVFTNSLSFNQTYVVIINKTAKDIYDNNLEEPFKMVFTTQRESREGDGKPGDDNFLSENFVIIGLILGFIILIIIILIFTNVIKKIIKKKYDKDYEQNETDDRQDFVEDNIAEEYFFNSDSEDSTNEFIKQLKKEALKIKKPSDFEQTEKEMLKKIKMKYKKGKISKESFEYIKEILIDHKQ